MSKVIQHRIKIYNVSKHLVKGKIRIYFSLNSLWERRFLSMFIDLKKIISKEIIRDNKLIEQLQGVQFKRVNKIKITLLITEYHYKCMLTGKQRVQKFDLSNVVPLFWKILEDILVRNKYFEDDNVTIIKNIEFETREIPNNTSINSIQFFNFVVTTTGEI